jgi:nitrite reductase/ring-hydroxylating ferredoxin subunit
MMKRCKRPTTERAEIGAKLADLRFAAGATPRHQDARCHLCRRIASNRPGSPRGARRPRRDGALRHWRQMAALAASAGEMARPARLRATAALLLADKRAEVAAVREKYGPALAKSAVAAVFDKISGPDAGMKSWHFRKSPPRSSRSTSAAAIRSPLTGTAPHRFCSLETRGIRPTMSSESATWHRVASRSKLTPANPLAVEVGDKLIGLYLLDGTVHAIGNLCTHEFALLTEGFIEGDAIECPLHQARFSIKTGKVLSEPADTDVPSYPVKVDGDDIYVGV